MAAFNLRATSKAVTVLVIVAVLVLFATVLMYLGMAGKLRSAVSEMQAKTKQVAESRSVVEKLEATKLAYLDARSQVRFLETSVSTQEFIPTLLKQIEHLGKSVNLKVLGVRPSLDAQKQSGKRSLSSSKQASEGNLEEASKSEAGGGRGSARNSRPYDELQIALQVEGYYMDLLDFLYRLTTFPKIVAVDSVEITPLTSRLQGTGSPRLNMKLTLTAFILRDDNKPEKNKLRPGSSIRPGSSDNVQLRQATGVAG
ncbi:MAG: type 4a pilus biogenesis protein PilO [Armatimonadota bacterium]|nr:type 4a pilus biogenesis protein PilO [Armatimonadota bacterium]